jgi:hypothetical protein
LHDPANCVSLCVETCHLLAHDGHYKRIDKEIAVKLSEYTARVHSPEAWAEIAKQIIIEDGIAKERQANGFDQAWKHWREKVADRKARGWPEDMLDAPIGARCVSRGHPDSVSARAVVAGVKPLTALRRMRAGAPENEWYLSVEAYRNLHAATPEEKAVGEARADWNEIYRKRVEWGWSKDRLYDKPVKTPPPRNNGKSHSEETKRRMSVSCIRFNAEKDKVLIPA